MDSRSPIDPSWTYYTQERSDYILVGEECPEQPYLSLTLSGDKKSLVVRRVVFTMVSRGTDFGPQESSKSFFEAIVLSASGQERTERHHVQSNVTYIQQPKQRSVTWENPDTEAASYGAQERPAKQAIFLGAIQAGDTIHLIPRAVGTFCCNCILEARIDVWVDHRNLAVRRIGDDSTGNANAPSYTELDQSRKEVRILRIESADESEEDGSLILSLRTISLAHRDGASFDALSYCWGTHQDRKEIDVKGLNGQEAGTKLQISNDLYSALQTLRHLHQPRWLWVDQICINQTDNAERSSQVILMDQIFASATNVVVWLGCPDADIEIDIEVMTHIANLYDNDSRERTQRLPWNNRPFHSIIEPENDQGPISTINDRIFSKPWFSRVWVLQEVWNAPAGATDSDKASRIRVQCGNREIQWGTVLQAQKCLSTQRLDTHNNVISRIWFKLFQIERKYYPLRCLPAERLDILTMLISGLDMQASDPRDKIFAMLIFGKETKNIQELPRLIRPDYTKQTDQVYADFTRWWIQENQSLRILSTIHAQHGRTWMDIWNTKNTMEPSSLNRPSWAFWHEGRTHWIQAALGYEADGRYKASGVRKVDIRPSSPSETSQPLIISLRGIRVGRIEKTFASVPSFLEEVLKFRPSKSVNEMHRAFASVPSFLEEVSKSRPSKSGNARVNKRHRAFAPKLKFRPSKSEIVRVNEMHRAFYHIFDPCIDTFTWKSAKVRVAALKKGKSRHANDNHLGAGSKVFPCYGNPWFEMERGLTGLCPFQARVGDVIVVLYGGLVPYILRWSETSGAYTLVGECYVNGIMQGEAFDLVGGEDKAEFFDIV